MDRVEKSIRVGCPVDVVYAAWRNFESFPSFMEYVEEVRVTGARTSHWTLKEPTGSTLEYDAEITADEPNRTLGWRSVGGDIGTSGTVNFIETDPQTTAVDVVMQWHDPPGGAFGEALSRLFRNPESMIENDLRRFKQIVEQDYKGTMRMTGERPSAETPMVSPSSPEAMAGIDDTIDEESLIGMSASASDQSMVEEPIGGEPMIGQEPVIAREPIIGREPMYGGGRMNESDNEDFEHMTGDGRFHEPVVSDYVYDVITALQSKLEAIEVYDTFISDCEAAGDSACVSMFDEMRNDDERHARRLADELKRLMEHGMFQERRAA